MFSLENRVLYWGLASGIGAIVVFLVFYLINIRLIFTAALYLIWILFLIGAVMLAKDLRNDDGHLSFAKAFSSIMKAFILASILYHITYFLMFNYIDPDLIGVEKAMNLEVLDDFSNLLSEDEMEVAADRLSKEKFTIMYVLRNFAISLPLPGFIIALIVSSIFKKEDLSFSN